MVLCRKRVILWRIFLKKLITKKELIIYSSFYDPQRGHTAHKAYKPIGYVFEYKFKDSETGKIKKFKITEKRIVTFYPKLAKKQIYEINKEVEKATLLKASQAKRSEYGDSAKYVIFTTADKKGNDTNGKVKVTMNDDLIKKSLELAGYNMLVTLHPATDVLFSE